MKKVPSPFVGAILITAFLIVISLALLNAGIYPQVLNAGSTVDLELAFPNLSFSAPVGIYDPGDGSNRLFVLEQAGIIKVFERTPTVRDATIFLDIRDRVDYGGEKGLLGLAFHPDFSDNGLFYVDYTTSIGGQLKTRISRFNVSLNDPNKADSTTEKILLEVEQPYSNHNGGQLAFGPDGYLYISLGDGGSAGDPQGNAQNLKTLLGSILRIDVDNPSNGKNYGIPPDNPFVGNTKGYREEIYAYGLRNTWRFSFDPQTGWLWAGDVGQNRQEEIDIIQKGKNYGWNIMEGALCYNPSSNCNQEGLELPIWTYGRDQGISITGGFVYRGQRIPELVGKYIYGDYGSGRIWALTYDGTGEPINEELTDTNLFISSFGVDAQQNLYICAYQEGKIYQLKATGSSEGNGSITNGNENNAGTTNNDAESQSTSFGIDLLQSFMILGAVAMTIKAKRKIQGRHRP